MNVNFNRVNPSARAPGVSPNDSLILYSFEDVVVPPSDRVTVHTGVRIAIPAGWHGQIQTLAGHSAVGISAESQAIAHNDHDEIVVHIYTTNFERMSRSTSSVDLNPFLERSIARFMLIYQHLYGFHTI